MEPRKGVKILAIILIVFYSISLVNQFFAIIALSTFSETFEEIGYGKTNLMLSIAGSSIVSILIIIGSIGMLKYKEWGRKIIFYSIMAVLALGLINLVYPIIRGIPWITQAISTAVVLLFGIWILIHLSKEKVKAVFSSA